MSEDDKRDKIVFSTSKDLCAIPAVDKSYLTEHYARVEKFNAVQKTRKEISKAERLAILQRSALDLRQDRAKEIKVSHTTIFEMVATFLNLDYQDVLQGALDSRQHLDLIADLLKAGGRGAVVFMHSLLPPPLDFRLSDSSVAEPTYQVVITDGSSYPITDRAVLVYRVKRDINIDSNNVCEELFYTIIEPGPTKNVMESLEGPLGWSATEPALSTSNWGELTKTPSGMKHQKEFLVKFTSFNDFLTATKDDLLRKLVFEIPDGVIDKIMSYPVEESITRSDPDFAKELQDVVKNWYKKIEKVLRSAQCVRKDIDDRGPRAESDYWRSLLTKFTSILEFSQLDEVQAILAALKSSRSFYILNWTPLINSIDAACNEASDNVRYLDDLNELSESLCTTPTPDLAELLRSMLYSIRLMFGCSRYFNTTERVTSLLIKVTNQVVMSFREYLTDSYSNTLWYIPKRTVISRIQTCLKIYKNYRKFFSETQQAMADNPNENEFGCSEVNIFVRLSSFCSRLERVNDVFQTYIDYSILQSSCLDGVGKMIDELENNLKGFVSYSNDPLDEKTPDLLEPYTVFKEKMAKFEGNVRSFCSHLVDLCPTVLSSIAILERFNAMKLPCLCLDVEYLRLLEKFHNELDFLRDRYNEEREENVSDVLGMAPFGGRIAWVRNLLHKIEQVMNAFKKRKFVINHERAQPVIRQYNCLCNVFLQNEIEHHDAWCHQLTDIHSLLEVPVFKRHNHAIKVNWSFYLREVIHEVEAMLKMGLTVPDYLVIMQFSHLPLLQNRDLLNNLAARYNALRRSIPQMYVAMLGPHLYRLDALMDLGHHEISWVSLDISTFCTQAGEEISKLEYFLQEISDLTNTRIVGSMKRLSETLLIDLSSDEPQYAQDLLTINEKRRKCLVKDFNTRVIAAENATIEIVKKFLDAYQVHSRLELNKKWLDNSKLFNDSDQLDDFTMTDQLAFRRWHRPKEEDIGRLYDDCMNVYSMMFKKVVAALLSSIVASLEVLRSRFNDEEDNIPLFATDIVLTPPTVQLAPNLNEVQAAVMALTKDTLQTLTELTMWGQRKEVTVLFREEDSEKIRPPSNLTNYFKLVYENKEVVRVVQSLQGCILLLKDDVSKVIGTYLEHNYLWAEGKFEEISRFMENDPDFFTLEDEVKRIVNFSQVITNLPHYHDVSCIRLNAGE